MKTILHTAGSRGNANHGWLQSHHTFSFAGYHHPERHHFGVLRVLNDDTVAGGMGFGTHPHRDMEIVSIPLEGDLRHQDNTGTLALIKHGDVQVMSAGSGIEHSEYNANADKTVKFLQIWIIPKVKAVAPRYQQISLNAEDRKKQITANFIAKFRGPRGLDTPRCLVPFGKLRQRNSAKIPIKRPTKQWGVCLCD